MFIPDGMHSVPQNGLNIGIVGSFIDIEPLNLSFDEIDGLHDSVKIQRWCIHPSQSRVLHNECKGQEDVPTRLEADEANI